jgi:hypothetical protein
MEQKKDGTQFDYMLMSIQFRIGISNTFVQILRYKKKIINCFSGQNHGSRFLIRITIASIQSFFT